MLRRFLTVVLALFSVLAGPSAWAHELWFQPVASKTATEVRLTFADSPTPGEAERVSEIAHARVWGNGSPLDVERQADGLLARWKQERPNLLSAYANRGVIDHQGDSFVIVLAAYSQTAPLKSHDTPALGLDDDQVRLLLVEGTDGGVRVRATWRGKPAADIPVTVFQGGTSTVTRTDPRGELAPPDPAKGPSSLLAVIEDKVPGKLDGKAFSHTRYKATLSVVPASPRS